MIEQTKLDQRGDATASNTTFRHCSRHRNLSLADEGPPDKSPYRRRRRPIEKEDFNRPGASQTNSEFKRAETMKTKTINRIEPTFIHDQKWGSKMSNEKKATPMPWRKTMTSVLALAMALGAAAPAYAAIDNLGSVTASTPDGGTVSDTSAESVTLVTPDPEFNLVKSITAISTLGGQDATAPDGGDTITYSYAVTNSGNVTIDASTVSITDPGPTFDGTPGTNTLGPIGYASGDANTDGELNPGETWIYTATYTLSQADVDASAGITDAVDNTVTAVTATTLGGDPVVLDTGGSTLTAEGTIPENGAVSLTKIATRDGSTEDDGSLTPYTEGDDIIYLFTVENTGNVTLSSLTVSETAFVAPSGAAAPTITCTFSGDATIASLAPGAIETCTATYTVQPTDL